MSARNDAYHVILKSMRCMRVDRRTLVAANAADALVDAGIIPSERDELVAAIEGGKS